MGLFEPALALDGGAGDGADALRALSADAAAGTCDDVAHGEASCACVRASCDGFAAADAAARAPGGAALQGGGFLALETDGWGQGELVAAMLEAMRAPGTDEALFERVAVMADYAGVRRFVTAWRTHAR